MAKIFISYRREDSAGAAGRLFDQLEAHFGTGQVFIDVDTIDPGIDFVDAVEQAVASSQVLIAVIGHHWRTATDRQGHSRLNDPMDTVRLEIQRALEHGVRVIPALCDGAVMPRSDELPDALARFARLNGMELTHRRFRRDATALIEVLERILEPDEAPGGRSARPDTREEPRIADAVEPSATQPESPANPPHGGESKQARLPAALSIETLGGESTLVLAGGRSLPAEAVQELSTTEDNQSAVTVNILLGGNAKAAENRSVLKFDLAGIPPAPKGESKINVHFAVDDRGILNVRAVDKMRNRTLPQRTVDLTEIEPPPVTNPRKIEDETNPTGKRGFADRFRDVFSDIFPEIGAREGAQQGADLRFSLEVSLEQAALGDTVSIVVNKLEKCAVCNGAGGAKACKACSGRGKVRTRQGLFTVESRCEACHGHGRTGCATCEGHGARTREKILAVKIPPGVHSGTSLRLAGEGDDGMSGGQPGDLYVEIKILEHPVFHRAGDDLFAEVPVTRERARRGGAIQAPVLGTPPAVTLELPSGTNDGAMFRLGGKGVKRIRADGHGDLVVRIDLYDGDKLSKALTRKLAALRGQMGCEIESN